MAPSTLSSGPFLFIILCLKMESSEAGNSRGGASEQRSRKVVCTESGRQQETGGAQRWVALYRGPGTIL